MMTVEDRLEGVGCVAQQMKAVGDLDRLGSALADAVCIGAGPITGDDLDTGMLSFNHAATVLACRPSSRSVMHLRSRAQTGVLLNM